MFKTKKQMRRLLTRHGCSFDHQGGNHEWWYSPLSKQVFALSHGGIKSRKIYLEILKQAGIKI
jgi:hypothetical protein